MNNTLTASHVARCQPTRFICRVPTAAKLSTLLPALTPCLPHQMICTVRMPGWTAQCCIRRQLLPLQVLLLLPLLMSACPSASPSTHRNQGPSLAFLKDLQKLLLAFKHLSRQMHHPVAA
jgi:hypothetical protein